MAGEHLKRIHTSTGSRKKFTYSVWFKSNIVFTSNAYLFALGPDGANQDDSRLYVSGGSTSALSYTATDANISGVVTDDAIRDYASWYHFMVVVDTTISHANDRAKLYINGARKDVSYTTTAAQNANISHNLSGEVLILGSYNGSTTFSAEGNYSDIFNVDGQALTPDVFGFYKEGKGYISAGSTQATDFRPGQWVPHTPRRIKSEINRRGGFGVNGFYLPMNDSSNFGADFHCAPNSIIKLKGEDLPQPRNGAPTTTDAYVSQLREDPYAANLVLAVPGISTSTSANLITNGTFDTNTTGWTVINSSAALSVDSQGRLQVNRTGSNLNAYQYITTEIGKRYTLSANLWSGTGGNFIIRAYQSNLTTSYGTTSGSTGDIKNLSFTALETTSSIILSVDNSGTAFVDNIVVRQEDAPRDYSADIKGSGTNKTVQATLGTGGVGYDIPSYYGSAINANDNNCGYAFSGADSAFVCPGDFTVEFWLDPVVATQPQGNPRILGQTNNSGGKWDIYIDSTTSTNRIYTMGGSVALTGGNGSSYGNFVPGQWNHFCLERSGSTMTTYMNGVAVYTQTYTNTIGTTDFLYLGSYGDQSAAPGYGITGKIQDFRFYKGVAKYKGGFDVPKPYTPVGIATWRAVPDCTANNFATLNALHRGSYNNRTLSNGNLTVSESSDDYIIGNIGVSTGKWYWEILPSTISSNNNYYGVVGAGAYDLTSLSYYYRSGSGTIRRIINSTGVDLQSGLANASANDVIGIALDVTNKQISWYLNGSQLGVTETDISSNGDYFPFVANFNSSITKVNNLNFGQNPTFSGNTTAGTFADDSGKGLFKYQPPTGFLALCEDNLPTPAIPNPGKHFKTVLYTGSGGSKAITGVGFQPDFIWVKSRTNTEGHIIFDSVRGANKRLLAMGTQAEATATGGVNSFDEDGYSTGVYTGTNQSGQDYVAWCWKAGGAAVSNTDGSITSQVSVNQDAGFSIATWSGNGGAGNDIGHGLEKRPRFWIVKRRNVVNSWPVYTDLIDGSLDFLYLDLTNAKGDSSLSISDLTSSTIPVGNANGENYVAYIWAEIEGYSKFGSYVGNGSTDGPFVYCGFKPAFVMIKRTDSTGNWIMHDNARNSTNPAKGYLLANSSGIEQAGSDILDFLSNGFKIRNAWTDINATGNTIIFAAFAESPFQTANAK